MMRFFGLIPLVLLMSALPARAELRLVPGDSLALPPGEATGLTWVGRDTLALLMVRAADQSEQAHSRIFLLACDRAGSVHWQVEFSGVLSRGLAWDGEFFWSCGDDREGGSLLFKIRADTVAIVASYPTPGHRPTALAYDGRWLWLTDRDLARIDRIDPQNGELTRSVNAPGFSPGGLAWDGRAFWVADAGTGLLTRLRGARLQEQHTVAADDWFLRGRDTLLSHDGRSLWILPAGSPHLLQVLLD